MNAFYNVNSTNNQFYFSLNGGGEITDNEESDAEQAPKVETPTPQIMNTKQSKTKPPGKIAKVHVCGDCGEQLHVIPA